MTAEPGFLVGRLDGLVEGPLARAVTVAVRTGGCGASLAAATREDPHDARLTATHAEATASSECKLGSLDASTCVSVVVPTSTTAKAVPQS